MTGSRYGSIGSSLSACSQRYGVDLPAEDTTLRPFHELNDAICPLDKLGKRASADSYLPAHEAIRTTLTKYRAEVEAPLRQLAGIEDFRLFVTTTSDDVLAQALDGVRYGGLARTEQVEYAPSGLPKDRLTDLSELDTPDRSAVLYLFGKAAVSPVFAAHDEDVLEFLYGLQAGLGQTPKRFFSAIRGANLLLIGCHFPDWLSRFLMRVAAPQRLSEQRGRKDFVIDPSRDETDFVVFLTTFARNTRISSMSPAAFVERALHALAGPTPAAGDGGGRRGQQTPASLAEASRLHQLLAQRHRAGPDAVRGSQARGRRRCRLVRQVRDRPWR